MLFFVIILLSSINLYASHQEERFTDYRFHELQSRIWNAHSSQEKHHWIAALENFRGLLPNIPQYHSLISRVNAALQETHTDLARLSPAALSHAGHRSPSHHAFYHQAHSFQPVSQAPQNEQVAWLEKNYMRDTQGGSSLVEFGFGGAPGDSLSEQYSNNVPIMRFAPKAPFFHTYNPTHEVNLEMFGEHGGASTRSIIVAKLPVTLFKDRLPGFIASQNPTEIYWVVQRNAWSKDAQILSRPHYWVDPNAPAFGNHSFQTSVHQSLYWPANPNPFYSASVSVHNHPGQDNMTIASPDSNQVHQLTRPGETFSFWSVSKWNNKVAVTLHWFLNHEDENRINNINVNTFKGEEWKERMERAHLPLSLKGEFNHLFNIK